MDTLKTAIVVVLLLAVLYGVYVILNKPMDQSLPEELAWQSMEPPQVELGSLDESMPAAGTDSAAPAPPAWPQSSAGSQTPAASPVAAGGQTPPAGPTISAPELLQSSIASGPAADGSLPRESESAHQHAAGPAFGTASAGMRDDTAAAAPATETMPAMDPPSADPSGAASPSVASPSVDVSALEQTQVATRPPETGVEQPAAEAGLGGDYRPAESTTYAPPVASRSGAFQPADGGRGGGFEAAAAGIAPPVGNQTAVASPQPSAEEATLSSGAKSSPGFSAFENAIQSATAKIEQQNWHDALWTLSLFYNSPDLEPDQNQKLLDWLDPLAARVIYSTEHLIEPPYEVRRGETLLDIAQQYQVPWQLLANINGVENPRFLVPGTKLKVLRGPFHAQVDLGRSELTLFVNKLYAGRFGISAGSDPAPAPGEFQVRDKQTGRTYYAGDGRTIPAGDPANPFGQVWLDLGRDVSIHGSPRSGPPTSGLGCISLSPRDATDVFGILSLGSKVVIRR